MMKRYLKIYPATFFIVNIFYMLIAIAIRRQADIIFPFIGLEFGVMIMSIFISFAIWIFRFEKGNSIVNVIIGYLVLIPAIYVMRFEFRDHLFRLTWLIYIIMVIVGIIYGIVVIIVSKKYKDEVDELNRLLERKDEEDNNKKQ